MSAKLVAIIAGIGPGTGAAIARKFAKSYPVILLARNVESYNDVTQEINSSGGKAIGISTDVSDEISMKNALTRVKEEFGEGIAVAAAVFNASGSATRKPFLETSIQDYTKSWDVSLKGAVIFSQAILPLLLRGVKSNPTYAPTLIFTGATASVKANALFTTFSSAKYGERALSSGLAKEFGPQGVHVSHAIIDGVIDTVRTKEWLRDMGSDAKINVDGIADAYWYLHTQPRSAFTWEIDIRPLTEKW